MVRCQMTLGPAVTMSRAQDVAQREPSETNDRSSCSAKRDFFFRLRAEHLLRSRGAYSFPAFAALPTQVQHRLRTRLVDFQSSVFQLDAYGESTWLLDSNRLASFWVEISAFACKLLPGASVDSELAEIRAFQGVEERSRSGAPVSLVPIDHFYMLKSCDVRLIRRCICTAESYLAESLVDLEPWNALDVLGEIDDDLSDLVEDLGTFNGNRILSSLRTRGLRQTLDEYSSYLADALRHCSRERRRARSAIGAGPAQAEAWSAAEAKAASLLDQIQRPELGSVLPRLLDLDMRLGGGELGPVCGPALPLASLAGASSLRVDQYLRSDLRFELGAAAV